MFNPGRTKKKKILYHDKYNDLYTHPCNTRILFRLYLYESTRYYSSRYYYSYNYSFTKKKKKKTKAQITHKQAKNTNQNRKYITCDHRLVQIYYNFYSISKKEKKNPQFDKIVKKKHDDVARIIPRQQQVKKKYTRGESKTQLIELLIGLD